MSYFLVKTKIKKMLLRQLSRRIHVSSRPTTTPSVLIFQRYFCDHPPRPRKSPADTPPKPTGPPKVDSTVFFRMTNPELFLDINSPRTWALVGFVWVSFGSYLFYLRRKENQVQEELDVIDSLKQRERLEQEAQEAAGNVFGPQRGPQRT